MIYLPTKFISRWDLIQFQLVLSCIQSDRSILLTFLSTRNILTRLLLMERIKLEDLMTCDDMYCRLDNILCVVAGRFLERPSWVGRVVIRHASTASLFCLFSYENGVVDGCSEVVRLFKGRMDDLWYVCHLLEVILESSKSHNSLSTCERCMWKVCTFDYYKFIHWKVVFRRIYQLDPNIYSYFTNQFASITYQLHNNHPHP